MKTVRILVTVDVTGYGRVEAGVRELPGWLADLLIERGFALPQGDAGGSPAVDEPPPQKRK